MYILVEVSFLYLQSLLFNSQKKKLFPCIEYKNYDKNPNQDI